MFRRDYMLRMIEEFAKAIGYAIGLKDSGKRKEGAEEMRKAYKTWFGLDAGTFARMRDDEFLEMLLKEKQFTFQQLDALAKGLCAEGDLLDETSKIEKQDRYSKALALLNYLEQHDTTTFSLERRQKVRELELLRNEA